MHLEVSMKKSYCLAAVLALFTLAAAADPWMSNTQTLAADSEDQFLPAIAYNSVHNEYLVVWQADVTGVHEIVGIRVASDGVPIGSSFTISEPGTNQFQPDVAYDPVNDRYLVVWVSDYSGNLTDTDIAGRFVPWNGPDAGSAVFGINGALTGQWTPSVVFNPGVNEFLVVWGNIETATPAWISAQRWAADGSGAVTPALTITTGSEYRINPKAVWNAVASEYLIVYERFVGGLEEDVWATRLSWSGSVLGTEIGIAGWPEEESQVDVASCRGDYLVVWKGGVDAGSKIYARAVLADGTVGATISNLTGGFPRENHPRVSCSVSGAEYLASWEGQDNAGNRDIIGAFLELDATPRNRILIYQANPNLTLEYTRPALTVGSHSEALVAWESDRPDLISQDIRGRLVGGRLFADGFESGDDGYWADN